MNTFLYLELHKVSKCAPADFLMAQFLTVCRACLKKHLGFAVSSNFHTRSLWQCCWVRQVQAVLRASQPDVTRFAKRRALLSLLPMSDLFSGKLPSTVQPWKTELLSQLLQNWKKYIDFILYLISIQKQWDYFGLFLNVFKWPNVAPSPLHSDPLSKWISVQRVIKYTL